MTLRHCTRSLAILTGCALSLCAQEKPKPAPDDQQFENELLALLNTPIVSASKREQKPIESPQAVESISGDQIRASGVFRLMDILRLATNVQILDGDGWSSRVALRGVAPNANPVTVQVLVDGVPLFNADTEALNIENIPVPIDAIERVEIVRGPSSSLYGANAQLGVIAITTKSAKSGVNGSLRTGWADSGMYNGQAVAGYGTDAFGIIAGYGGLSYQKLDKPYHVVGTGLEYMPENGYHQSQLFVKPEFKLGSSATIWASFGRAEEKNSPERTMTTTLLPIYGSTYGLFRTETAQAGWSQTWSPTLRTELKVQQAKQAIILGPGFTPADSIAPGFLALLIAIDPTAASELHVSDLTTKQVSLQVNWDPSQILHIVAGGDTRSMETPGSILQGIPAIKPTGSGGFLSLDWNLNPVTISLGARVENETLGGSRTSPRAALVWSLDSSTVLRAGYYTATRSPLIAEAYASFDNPILPYGQALAVDLKPEEAQNMELGFRKNFSRVSLDLTYYHTTLKKQIVNTIIATTPQITNQYHNSPENKTNQGLEATLTASVAQGWMVGCNAAYVKFEDPSRETQADWAPKTTATLWVKATVGKFFGFASLQHVGSYTVFTNASTERETRDAHFQTSFNIGYEPFQGFSVSAYGVNAARPTTSGIEGVLPNSFLVRYARRELGLQAAYRF